MSVSPIVLKRIFLLLLTSVGLALAGHSSEPWKERWKALDSLKHIDNPRWWYPGEPLQWVVPGLIDSLFQENFDGFYILEESPRAKNYNKTIWYSRAPTGEEALFILGDCRYISYDRGKTNASQSIVNGHTHHSCHYWKDGVLYFQNGHANWMRHAQRLYHSRETQQMERHDTAPPPPGIEVSAILPTENGSLFLAPVSETMTNQKVIPAYLLPHSSSEFEWLGTVNPSIGEVSPLLMVFNLKDYLIYRNGSSMTVIRKSDLSFVNVPSGLASQMEAQTKEVTEKSWTAWKGNTLYKTINGGRTIEVEDLDALVSGASWSPLILPANPPNTAGDKEPIQDSWSWTMAFVMFGAIMVLLFDRLSNRSRTRFIPVEQTEDGMAPVSLSKETEVMLAHCGRRMASDDFDRIIGLEGVASPETRRSRRSRYIQLVNAEAQARFGRNLIERVRSEADKRVVLYEIARLDEPKS